MPHFKIQGSFSLDPPSAPKFAVDWYKTGGIMTRPTLFGINGSRAMAGGEAGAEAILPLDMLWERLAQILNSRSDDGSKMITNNISITVNTDSDDPDSIADIVAGRIVEVIENM